MRELENFDRCHFRLSSVRVIAASAELSIEYSLDEREGRFIYAFRVPRRPTPGASEAFSCRYGLENELRKGSISATSISVLPGRVKTDALKWLDDQVKRPGALPDAGSIWNDFRATIQAAG